MFWVQCFYCIFCNSNNVFVFSSHDLHFADPPNVEHSEHFPELLYLHLHCISQIRPIRNSCICNCMYTYKYRNSTLIYVIYSSDISTLISQIHPMLNSSPNTTSSSDPARSSSTGSTSSGFSSDIHRYQSFIHFIL